MSRNDLWKWLVLVFLAILSVYTVYPPKEKIRLGLDLSGGTSFTIAIDQKRLASNLKAENPDQTDAQVQSRVDSLLRDADDRVVEVIRNRIDGLGVNEPVIQGGKNHRITVQLPGISEESRRTAEQSLQSAAFLEFKLVSPNNADEVDKLFKSGRIPEGYELGEDGQSFKRSANYNELVKDPEYLNRLGRFEVRDPRYQFMLERFENEDTHAIAYRPVFVRRKAEMTGGALSRASVEVDSMTGKVQVQLTFNAKGAAEFARLTKAYAPHGSRNKDKDRGRQLAIILDDTLYSAPTINEEIPNGKAVINGSFSWAEAAVLRNILNAGSLPAPMKVIEKRSIESTLGSDAIHSGLMAGILGLVLIMIFMLCYYCYCGVLANVALILDIVLLPAGLIIASNVLGVFVQDAAVAKKAIDLPVLTMPGIAGIVLTVGMAVDANVLIFERIREEFKLGKSARAAVAAGYDNAFLAIFDSNITTMLTAALLFIFGAGPIRGFAITLSAGIIISMFTALVVTRLIFNLTVSETRVKPYKMLQLLKNPNFDFVKWGKTAFVTSVLVALVTVGLFFGRAFHNPASVMSVDFTGGEAMTFQFDSAQKMEIGEVRKIAATLVNDATIQYQDSLEGSAQTLLVKTSMTKTADGKPVADAMLDALRKAKPEAKFLLANSEEVGSEIGADLKKAAIWASIWSLAAILIYVSLRFEFAFALGGVIALAHDALITLGLYSLFGFLFGGRQVGLMIVTALLTIIGYSINDTIVIFDRIREDLRKDQKSDLKTLCNKAINSTLSRTLLTSITTLIACLTLFIFGGGAINDFALAMVIGVLVGTYSSVFVAVPVMIWWFKGKRPVSRKTV
ncbi:MAG: protein translocase subunit SecD [Kiritimatiellae bacterium]|nr:protein translocase subunit SecD [Kiritimatiellia bacterium]